MVRTGFGQDYTGLFNLATRIAGLAFLSPEQGAQTGIYLASDPGAERFNGEYFVKCRGRKSLSRLGAMTNMLDNCGH